MLVIRSEQMEALSRVARQRLARETLDELYHSSPHAMLGLSPAETEARLQTTLAKANSYSFYTVRDIRAFVRLCFRIGQDFDLYPPFQEIFTSRPSPRLGALFERATDADWAAAAVYDIVGRSRDAAEQPAEGASPSSSVADDVSVSLVALKPEHAAVYHRQVLHPDVWRLADLEPLADLEDVEDYIRSMLDAPNRVGHAIVHTDLGFVGAIVLRHNGPTARLLYWVGRRFWGKGVATAAVRQQIALLRGHPTIQQVTAEIFAGNAPSMRVLEKCGFVAATQKAEQRSRRYRLPIDTTAAAER